MDFDPDFSEPTPEDSVPEAYEHYED